MKDNAKPPLNDQQRGQVYKYYLSLKRFVEITGGSNDRSMTARAQKARSKLLKLSESQFFELSTDVNDELERRIDENHSQSSFLMPNDNFHAKRNQARQKLANLSDVRFNDLVDDILYEITRRSLHELMGDVVEENVEQSIEPLSVTNIESTKGVSSPGSINAGISDEEEPRLENDANTSIARYNDNSASNTMLLLSEVIPKTASIDWTSEEEDEEEKEGKESQEEEEEEEKEEQDLEMRNIESADQANQEEQQQEFFDSVIMEAQPNEESNSPEPVLLEEKLNLRSSAQLAIPDGNETPIINNAVYSASTPVSFNDEPLSQSSSHNALQKLTSTPTSTTSSSGHNHPVRMLSLSQSVKRNKDRDIELLLAEGNKLEETIKSLEEEKSILLTQLSQSRYENSKLKNELEKSSTTKALDDNFQKSIGELTSQLNNLSIENEVVKQENSELQLKLKNLGSPIKSNNTALERDVKMWKSKYEAIVSKRNLPGTDLAPIINPALFPPSCTIPSHLIDEFDLKLQHILGSLSRQSISDEEIFKEIAAISDDSLKISNLASTQETKAQKILLENVLSHAITSVRYYATYQTPLLRFVLQNALSEVANAVYDLVRLVNVGSKDSLPSSNRSMKNMDSTPELASPVTPFDENLSISSAPKFILEKPSAPSSSKEVEMSPVKPLKITQKKTSEDTINKPVSARKPSGPGLFTAMLNGSAKKPNNSTKSKNKFNLILPLEQSPLKSTKALSGSENMQEESQDEVKPQYFDNASNEKFSKAVSTDIRVERPQTPVKEAEILKDDDDVAFELLSDIKKENTKSNPSPPTVPTPSSPNKSKLIQSLNSEIFSDEQTPANSDDESPLETDNESTYEALRDAMKMKVKKEGEREENGETSFKPVIHHEPIEPNIDDLDLNEKPFDFESKNEAINNAFQASDESVILSAPQYEAANITGENPKEPFSSGVSLPSSSPTTPNPSISPPIQMIPEISKDEVIISPLRPVTRASKLYESNLSHKNCVPQQRITSSTGNSEYPTDTFDHQPQVAEKELPYSEEEEPEFDVDAFDIENPDNSLSDLLLYLEYQTMDVINTIQSLLSSIKEPKSTTGELRLESNAINQVIRQMVEATSVSMNQSRNASLKEHGSWVVQSLDDCRRRMTILCHLEADGSVREQEGDEEFGNKHFKQRLAGITFDVAKCTKELVKTVEQASLKSNIDYLNAQLSQ